MRFVTIGLLICCFMGCQATQISNVSSKDIVGEVSAQQLLSTYPDFMAEYQAYKPNDAEISAIKQLDGQSIIVLFGSWCHDSEREVPRLLKLFDTAKMSRTSLQLIGVNKNKQEPSGKYRSLALRYTPTIIMFDGDKELGRIVERPMKSLGEDLATFLP